MSADYFADTTAASNSMLSTLHKSPRIYEATYVTKTLTKTVTPAMTLGSAVRCLALEPYKWLDQYWSNPFENRRSKAFKEWAEKLPEGASILNPSESLTVEKCAHALMENGRVARVLEMPGDVEREIHWQDPLVDAPCKAKLDKVLTDQRMIWDIKTTNEMDPKKLAWKIFDYGYHRQAAHYTAGMAAITDTPVHTWTFAFAFVETCIPYRTRVVVLDEDFLQMGFAEREVLLSDWKSRSESGDWSEPDEGEIFFCESPMRRRA